MQWLPPADDASRAQLVLRGGAADSASAADHLTDFERETGRVLDMIEGVMPEAAWLSADETLTCLHSTISTHEQRIALPSTPMHLDAQLADETLVGGLVPQPGNKHLRTLTVTRFPAATVPGMLELRGCADLRVQSWRLDPRSDARDGRRVARSRRRPWQ